MRYIKITTVGIAIAAIAFFGVNDSFARGGGGHMGGGGRGGGGGGWSGGHGGEYRGGGDHGDHGNHGDHGDWGHGDHGDHGDWGHGDHGRHNNNNNNNNNSGNTTNNYTANGGGWGGGWGWGAGDDALAGMAVGAVIASAASQPSTVVVEQPSTTVIQQAAPAAPGVGSEVATLPQGCQARNVNGVMAYESNGIWYKPFFGPNGVYYQVMPPPPADSQT